MIPPLVRLWVGLSLLGTGLIAVDQVWWSQALWLVSNAGLAIHNRLIGQTAQAGLFGCFWLMAAGGVVTHWPWGTP